MTMGAARKEDNDTGDCITASDSDLKKENEKPEQKTSKNGGSDFEYHVQFPEAVEYDEQVGTGRIERIWPIKVDKSCNNDMKKEDVLVVVLLGWAGSEHKYLSKYSDIYLERGCIVVRYITPLTNLFLDMEELAVLASKLLQVLIDWDLDGHPLFFHAFSNGGGFTYSYILREIALGHYPNIKILGTIFDSAPTPRDILTCFKALVSIFAPYRGLRYLLASMAVMFIVLNIFWYHVRTAFHFCFWGDVVVEKGGIIRTIEAPSQNWLGRISQLKDHSFLFIYSDADTLIPSRKVEHFAEILAKGGNTVQYKKFVDSEHVQHFRKYPKEYVQSVTDFLRMVMTQHTNEGIEVKSEDD